MIWILCFHRLQSVQLLILHVMHKCVPVFIFWTRFDSNMINFFIAKLIIFVAYVNWALFVSIGLQCVCIERRLICLVWIKQNCLVKLKNVSCVFMPSAWTNTWSWGSLCQSFCLFYSFFPVSDLRKLALSTTLHPKCLSLVKKLQCVPVVQKKSYNVFISVFYQY